MSSKGAKKLKTAAATLRSRLLHTTTTTPAPPKLSTAVRQQLACSFCGVRHVGLSRAPRVAHGRQPANGARPRSSAGWWIVAMLSQWHLSRDQQQDTACMRVHHRLRSVGSRRRSARLRAPEARCCPGQRMGVLSLPRASSPHRTELFLIDRYITSLASALTANVT